jgi:HEAT repeat protein
VFPLIEDRDPQVTSQVLDYLGSRRNPEVEARLLHYLKGHTFQRPDRQHALACYRALGLCGGAACLPFLRETLLDESFMPDVNKSLGRQGAAVALNLLVVDEARALLKEASESRFSSVRMACRKADEYETELAEMAP